MADFSRTAISSLRPSAAKSDAAAARKDDILERATTILTQETSYLPGSSGPAKSVRGTTLDLSPLSGSMSELDQLRERAIDAVTKLLATVAAASSQSMEDFGFPWRKAAMAARPGSSVGIPLTIDNAEDRPVTLTYYSTDLASDSGYRIPVELISFDPPSQIVAPRSQGIARMTVAVPLQALAGSYSALVQALGLAASKAVVTLDVL